MPRRYATLAMLAAALAAVAGCPSEEALAPDAGGRSRVVSVSDGARPAARAAEWCDVYYPAGSAPALGLPPHAPLLANATARPAADRWMWLNLWATWCKPCLREMPLIRAFGDRLREEGAALDNWYLTIDEDQAALQAFLAGHRELIAERSLRDLTPERIEAFLAGLGLAEGTSIPVSVLVAPGGKVRCVRTGSIADGDYPIVKAVLDDLARPP